MDIRCRKRDCKFNNKFTCTAKEILIMQDCYCSMYAKTDKPTIDTSRTMFEKTPDYAPQRESLTMCIKCRADCMFNEKSQCTANGITVNSLKEKPYCITFLKKCKKRTKQDLSAD